MIAVIFEKAKILLIPLAIILLILLGSILFLKPQVSGILADQKELSLQKTKLAKMTAKVAFLESMVDSELEIKTKATLDFLPAEKDLPRVLATIRNLTNANGLGLEGVQVEPGDISSSSAVIKSERYGLETLELKITVSGDWVQLKSFLSQVEGTSPLMRVGKAEISSFPPAIEAIFSLNSFFLSLPTTLGASETPLVAISPQEEEIYQQLVKIASPVQEVFQTSSSGTSGRENPFTF